MEISIVDCSGGTRQQAVIAKCRVCRKVGRLERWLLLSHCVEALSVEALEAAGKDPKETSDEPCREVLQPRIEAEEVSCRRLGCGGLCFRCENMTNKEILSSFG